MPTTYPTFPGLPPADAPLLNAGAAQIWIARPPAEVYALVSELTRMGEYSPECYRVEWLEGADGPAPGARARGWNRNGNFHWTRDVVVLVALPGQEFTFQTLPRRPMHRDSTIWRYTFAPQEQGGIAGTALTESYAIVRSSVWMRVLQAFLRRPEKMPDWMMETLQRIKRVAEAQAEAPLPPPDPGNSRPAAAPSSR